MKKKILIVILVLLVLVPAVLYLIPNKELNNNENNEFQNQSGDTNGRVIIGIDKITNIGVLDCFIDNTNVYNDMRVSDKVEIITYTIEGDEIINTIEYKKEDNLITLTRDNTKDKFASEDNRKVTVKDFEFPKYRVAKIIKDNRINIVITSDDDTYDICSYSLREEKEKDTSRTKIKDASLKAEWTSTEELVFYNGVLYGKSFAVIDYAPNTNGPVDVINKLVGEEYLPTLNRETNTEKLLNSYVDSVGVSSIVLNVNGIYVLYNAID